MAEDVDSEALATLILNKLRAGIKVCCLYICGAVCCLACLQFGDCILSVNVYRFVLLKHQALVKTGKRICKILLF